MSYVDEVRVWCRHCHGTGKERFDRRNPYDCSECHGRGYTIVWPTDEQRKAAKRERYLLAEVERLRDESSIAANARAERAEAEWARANTRHLAMVNHAVALQADINLLRSAMACGHPTACIVVDDDGTNHCGWCEDVALAGAREGGE